MDAINNVIIPLSILAGALATIFGLFSLIVRGIKWFLALPQEVRNYFYKPRFILIPTPAEIALYGAKEPCSSVRMTVTEYIEEQNGRANRRHERWQRDTNLRLMVLRLCLASIYAVFLLKLTSLLLMDGAEVSASPRFPMIVFMAFIFAFAIVAFRLLGPERRAEIVKNFWY